MFNGCSSLTDIAPLRNWNVSKGEDFEFMFGNCLLLSNIEPLQNWNISNTMRNYVNIIGNNENSDENKKNIFLNTNKLPKIITVKKLECIKC